MTYIKHGGPPILRWQVSNAAITTDPAGNRKVTKKRSTGHVDGLVALLMAIGQAKMPVEVVAPAPKLQLMIR